MAEGEEDGDIEWWGIIVMICLSFASFKNRGSIYNAGGMSNTDEAVFDNKKSYFDVRDEKSLPQTSGTYHQTGGI